MKNVWFEQFSFSSHAHLIDEMTELLHVAYAALAKQGLHFVASHQTSEFTRNWLSKPGETHLAFQGNQLVGTVTLLFPKADSEVMWFRKENIYTFHKFAVSPELQGQGLGSYLLEKVESRARELGAVEIALDTSEKALQLIAMYEKRGYRFIQHIQWSAVNYRSVVMSKSLR